MMSKNRDKFKLYKIIVDHFCSTLSSNANCKKSVYVFHYGSEEFLYKSTTINRAGFMRYTADKDLRNKFNSKDIKIQKNKEFSIKDIKAEHYQEVGPQYIAEHELVREMEQNHIGTDGTIPKHIHNILFRKYVEVFEKGSKIRRLKPTALGYALAEGYSSIDPELLEPTVRNYIEDCSEKVENFELYKDTVLDKVNEITKKKLHNFMNKFEDTIEPTLRKIVNNPNLYDIEDDSKGLQTKVPGGDYLLEVKH